jgi:hypothetical protein
MRGKALKFPCIGLVEHSKQAYLYRMILYFVWVSGFQLYFPIGDIGYRERMME